MLLLKLLAVNHYKNISHKNCLLKQTMPLGWLLYCFLFGGCDIILVSDIPNRILVEPDTLMLESGKTDTLIIRSVKGTDIRWRVSDYPDWVSISQLEGVLNGSSQITIRPDTAGLEERIHPGTLLFESIGGNAQEVELSISVQRVLFEDDFDGDPCPDRNKWVVGGRIPNFGEVSCKDSRGHLKQAQFPEITLTPSRAPFPFSQNLSFSFQMEVALFDDSSVPIDSFSSAGVDFFFLGANQDTIGRVSYLSATSDFPFDEVINDPSTTIVEGENKFYELTGEEIISQIIVDRNIIEYVSMSFRAFSSTSNEPTAEAEIWIDRVIIDN